MARDYARGYELFVAQHHRWSTLVNSGQQPATHSRYILTLCTREKCANCVVAVAGLVVEHAPHFTRTNRTACSEFDLTTFISVREPCVAQISMEMTRTWFTIGPHVLCAILAASALRGTQAQCTSGNTRQPVYLHDTYYSQRARPNATT